jgi:prophage regulatory protein
MKSPQNKIPQSSHPFPNQNQFPYTATIIDDDGSLTPVKFLRYSDLRARGISYSNVHLLRLEADGKFPQRVYLSPARVVWIEAEIDAYIARCIAARG